MVSQLLTFLIPVTLLTLTPGVDTLLVIRNTHRGGWRDGAASSLGICSGLFVHALLSAVGISLILLQSAFAFNALKICGSGYLVWLGFTSLRRAGSRRPLVWQKTQVTDFQFRRSLVEGFLSNVLNPKTIVFYMAFLPQFIDPAKSALLQSLLLAALHFAVAMFYQCLLAAAVDRAGRWLGNPTTRRVMDALTGSVMLLFGIKLALESR
jgi:threonine/homoserine/homoserine lactone efflux protein